MRARDAYDSTRSIAPLKPADDAVVLDTTDLSIDETYERTLALVRAAAQT
jgi:cytidylate kinase